MARKTQPPKVKPGPPPVERAHKTLALAFDTWMSDGYYNCLSSWTEAMEDAKKDQASQDVKLWRSCARATDKAEVIPRIQVQKMLRMEARYRGIPFIVYSPRVSYREWSVLTVPKSARTARLIAPLLLAAYQTTSFDLSGVTRKDNPHLCAVGVGRTVLRFSFRESVEGIQLRTRVLSRLTNDPSIRAEMGIPAKVTLAVAA